MAMPKGFCSKQEWNEGAGGRFKRWRNRAGCEMHSVTQSWISLGNMIRGADKCHGSSGMEVQTTIATGPVVKCILSLNHGFLLGI